MARLLLQGKTTRQIADALGVSQPTIVRDVGFVRAEWRERRVDLVNTLAMEDLARTDVALRAIMAKIERGDNWSIDRLVALLTYRAKVLGLENVKAEIGIGDELVRILERLGQASASGQSDA